MNRSRSVKIVATIGPASCDPGNLEKLFVGGVDIFRVNFSHGSHDGHAAVYNAIRSIGKKHRAHPTILADLQGPKLRIGTFDGDKIVLKSGDVFRFDLDPTPGSIERVNLPHPEILEALHPGSTLLLDDGKLRFEVTDCGPEYAEMKVLVGGPLSNRKGVNVPDVMLKIPVLTEKDARDLNFALQLGVDWVALSFVQSAEDVRDVKRTIDGRAGVISKLEKPLAIRELEPIVQISDGIMIARGDLGVELPQEEVPSVQRQILNVCHRMGRPVIVATQMLESMIAAPVPTRAEVSDVANAVYGGTDATMLSAESASGQHPFDAVSIMSKVIERTEVDPSCLKRLEDDTQLPQRTVMDAICAAAKDAAEFAGAAVIVLFTDSFEFVVRCSRMRPRIPVILVTNDERLAHKAGLCHGVYAIVAKKEFDGEAILLSAKSLATEYKFATVGDNLVVINNVSDDPISVSVTQL
jgi:pyruvate kinase